MLLIAFENGDAPVTECSASLQQSKKLSIMSSQSLKTSGKSLQCQELSALSNCWEPTQKEEAMDKLLHIMRHVQRRSVHHAHVYRHIFAHH